MPYPGGKGKTYQHLINLMPPHDVYIEAFLGGGAVLKQKQPALRNIGIEIDGDVLSKWQPPQKGQFELHQGDALTYLRTFPFQGSEVVYCDPPYLPETRRRRRVYLHDYSTENHVQLLDLLATLPCHVLISGYDSALYKERLQGWQQYRFRAKTHASVATEVVWYNYPPPGELHDPRHLGETAHRRQTIKRRQERLKHKILTMPEVERHAFIDWLTATYDLRRPSQETR